MKEKDGVCRRDMWRSGRVSAANREEGHRGPGLRSCRMAIISVKVDKKGYPSLS